MDTTTETLGFQSEVNQLLHLVINSLYGNREIFLRELISNAADAADKLRYETLSDDGLYEGDPELRIAVDFSADLKTVTVRDNGIGMSRDDVISHLGTIAKSGTKEFFSQLSGDSKSDSALIGQFGVGFYSAFIVADTVTVTSRRAGLGEDEGVRWESDGKGEFTVQTVKRKKRGTEVVLHLKDDAVEFANGWRLRELVKRYSDHIPVPVEMPKEGEDEKGFETVNQATALWMRQKKDISDDEYKAFYKHVSHDFEDPLDWVHTRAEGKLEYTTLFYIPARAPFDLWDRERVHGVKLYVQRVFIMDDTEHLLPRYLRFIRGIVDSSDLPLNVSREILQSNRTIDSIRAASVKKILGLIEAQAKGEDYGKFWSEFGRVLKEGLVEDTANQEQLAQLLRFRSTRFDGEAEAVSLADYVGRMKEGQEAIYYITADNLATARHSPHLEIFRKRDIEVLLLADPVDEFWVSHLPEFDGKPLTSAAHGALDLPQPEAESEDEPVPETSAEVVDKVKVALGDRVKDVRASSRLTSSPSCLVADEGDMSASLQRLLKASGQEIPEALRILELNLRHPLVAALTAETDDSRLADWSLLLFEQAVLAEGSQLDDPTAFINRMNSMLVRQAGE